jgi:hypothetical protein
LISAFDHCKGIATATTGISTATTGDSQGNATANATAKKGFDDDVYESDKEVM